MNLPRGAAHLERRNSTYKLLDDERKASVIDVSQPLGTLLANLKAKMREAGVTQDELKVFHKVAIHHGRRPRSNRS
jgi:hypothetical protein